MKSNFSNISPFNTAVTATQTIKKVEALLKPNTLEQNTQPQICHRNLCRSNTIL